MISRFALPMFDQGRFKVKVIVQGLTLYNCIPCPLFISRRVGDILKELGTNIKYHEMV